MLLADTYVDRIDFLKYLPQTDCGVCGAKDCGEFVEALKRGGRRPTDCPDIPEHMHYPFQVALDADHLLPKFPCLDVPRPGPTGLTEINSPDDASPILISGNNVHTQDVLTTILGTTKSPFYLLCTDTRGDTVDMAVILKSLTVETISAVLIQSGIFERTAQEEITIPGLASGMADALRQKMGWKVTVGPVCAAELPLFFGEKWLPPAV
ncbi:MAG: (Fe-S)-binding protein [Deltaproteobacteria bacterium]|jgi:CO dehydrogenase/acetyl-CoA synthase gamma subunit (corrinoid Fe-S protein)